ncbi:uncharacterized protein LOC117125341 [Anneissia japonica]|uniref:uncharacterized protein LOC117125341 n=1 Tax=Anneissia japonica TaxID=1529436 RepID=UPI001425B5B2|nr:uncharacterized protein LOC117125341 [Anneissia japonica]
MVDCPDNGKQTSDALWSRTDVLSEARERILLKRQLRHRTARLNKRCEVDTDDCPRYRKSNSARQSFPQADSELLQELIPPRSYSAPYSYNLYDDIWKIIGLGPPRPAFSNMTREFLDKQSKHRSSIKEEAKHSSEAQEVIHQLRPDATSISDILQRAAPLESINGLQHETLHTDNEQLENTSECKYDTKEVQKIEKYSTQDNTIELELTNAMDAQEHNRIKTKRRKKKRRFDWKSRTNYSNEVKKTRNSLKSTTKNLNHRSNPREQKCPQTTITEQNMYLGNNFKDKQMTLDKCTSTLPLITPERLIREKSFQMTYPGYDVRFKEPILTREPTNPGVDKQIQKDIRDSSIEKCRMWLKNWAIN